jgi:hypothetical protein
LNSFSKASASEGVKIGLFTRPIPQRYLSERYFGQGTYKKSNYLDALQYLFAYKMLHFAEFQSPPEDKKKAVAEIELAITESRKQARSSMLTTPSNVKFGTLQYPVPGIKGHETNGALKVK